jgi:FkbM family methyltransferase
MELKRGQFRSEEPEFDWIPSVVKPGDWVLDIGANIGYYTILLSGLVGKDGRVFAFEPITDTVEILSYVVRKASQGNVTIFNVAVSDQPKTLHFSIPNRADGLPNYFAALSTDKGEIPVYATSIDALTLPQRVSFVKIDVEWGEEAVIRGMQALIQRDRPILMIEAGRQTTELLQGIGYRPMKKPDSPNLIFWPEEAKSADMASATI